MVGQGAERSLDAPEEFEELQGPPREHAQEGVERAGIARLAPCWLRPCHPEKEECNLGCAQECQGREHKVNKR